MSQLPKVAIFVYGDQELLPQTYKDYTIIYKSQDEAQADFYNRDDVKADIYGFFGDIYDFTTDSSLQEFIDRFNYHKLISAVYSNFIIRKKWTSYEVFTPPYTLEVATGKTPLETSFFARSSAKPKFNPELKIHCLADGILSISQTLFLSQIPKPLLTVRLSDD